VQRVLLLGGYGAFGGRIAERLAREPGVEVIVAGRSLERAVEFAARMQKGARARLTPARLDGMQVAASELAALRPVLVINASGPYQRQDYRLARACVAAGVHYLDLADARAFVTGIGALDAEATRAGVLVVSGASTVPAVSGAVIDEHAPQFASLEAVTIVISPGNSFDPGLAATQSILSTLGRPFATPRGGAGAAVHGWQHLRRRIIPGLGARWLGECDTPDLDLLSRRYPGLGSVRVFAALEVGAFHLGLWGLSWLVRGGLLRSPERLAAPLLSLKHTLRFLGSDVGGMAVTLEGKSLDGGPKRIDWHLVARQGHGPYIPAMPSVILAKRLLAGTLVQRGAMPCLGLFTLADFVAEVDDLDITAGVA
jgi:NAD(P)-dependent dehydrogenase (short-subunit alcohol dehydrogenase family)